MIRRFWRDHPYLGAFAFSSLVLTIYCALLYLTGGRAEWQKWYAQVPLFIYSLAWLSVLAIGLAKRLMALEWAPLAVARTVVDEALRMKIAVVFVVALLVWLAAMPFLVEAGTSPLRYRIQLLIQYGLTATGTLLSLMTVFLACGTLSLEIQDQRIFTTLSKPISRWQYLLGKWLGLLMLNTALMVVAGSAIFASVWYMSRQPAMDIYDRVVVNQEVLTARVSVAPKPPEREFESQVRARIEKLKVQAPKQYGETREDQRKAERQIREELEKQWWSVPPQGSRTYVFKGLKEAKRRNVPVQIRMKLLYIGKFSEINQQQGQRVWRKFQVNGRELPPEEIVLGRFRNLIVPPELIDDNGEVRMTLLNNDPLKRDRAKNITLLFVHEIGLEALYQADSFAANYWRGVAMLWVKLAFLAALGLTTATFLGFPVACLVSMVILVAAWLSGYLLGEIDRYGIDFESTGAKGLALIVRMVVSSVASLLQQYSRFVPGPQVADGRLVPWSELLACVGWIGVVWCGLTGFVGGVIFRIREVGRVQV